VSTEQWSRLSTDALNFALYAYIAGMIGYFYYLAFRRQFAWRVASVAAFLGLSAHAVSVVSRGVAAGRVPWGNNY
jgi:ABC-type transport system involved in cytochrome c biogenesis permease subunit